MPMPAGFAHADIFMHGRPRHGLAGKAQTYDAFYRKHPPMDAVHRAKIFAPFDALRGFSEAIAAKVVLYEEKKMLTEGEKEELDKKIGILNSLTANSGLAREHKVSVTVTHFVLCADPQHEACGRLPQCIYGIIFFPDHRDFPISDLQLYICFLLISQTGQPAIYRVSYAVLIILCIRACNGKPFAHCTARAGGGELFVKS